MSSSCWLGPGERLVDAPRELSEAGIEHGALGLRVGREPVQSSTQLLLCLHQARLELVDRLQALALEALGHLREALLETARARVADLRQPLCEHGLCLACECLHGAFELAGKSRPGRLTRSLDRIGKLLRGSF